MKTKSRLPLHVEITRGSLVESIHQVVYVVVDRKGQVIDYNGNFEYVIAPRSSLKLLQAIPLVESGAADAYKLHDRHIVLACASHRAQKPHIEAVQEWLKIIGQPESILRCGPTAPTNSSMSHNCSGKHLGMVTTSMHLKIDPANYDRYEHPYQELLRKVLTEIIGLDYTKLPYGGDGCGIPTYGIPIQRLAYGMSHFFKSDVSDARKKALTRIISAIQKCPEYLSAEDDNVFHLIKKTQGRCILKPGAEGTYTGLMPEKGYAFALKVIDGNCRAADFASMLLFKHYGAIDTQEAEELREFLEPAIFDSRGIKVGQIRLPQGVG